MFMLAPGPPIDMSGLFVTTRPAWPVPVQLAVEGLVPLVEPEPAMPVIPLIAIPDDSPDAAG